MVGAAQPLNNQERERGEGERERVSARERVIYIYIYILYIYIYIYICFYITINTYWSIGQSSRVLDATQFFISSASRALF